MSYFRVHPNINIARVGNSQEYYLAPETAAGEVVDKETGLFGGLPIKPNTENTAITEDDFRDANQAVKRQAARFRLYAYDVDQTQYPSNDPGREVKIGDIVGGKVIKDIIWQVHLANKKNNNFTITSEVDGEQTEEGIVAYENGGTPPLRNSKASPFYQEGSFYMEGDLGNEDRRRKLVIDAGPRALSALTNGSTIQPFGSNDMSNYVSGSGEIVSLPNYPTSFPNEHFDMYDPLGEIDTLGELEIEANTGRLIVVGGYGRASCVNNDDGSPQNLCDAIDNNGWFDDTSDGPVCATIIFEDGSVEQAIHGWVVCTDPGYAPQTRNVVSTWDDMYDTWIQQLQLQPQVYNNGFQENYSASFDSDVLPVFHAAFLQRWNTALPQKGIKGHEYMASITPSDDPKAKLPSFQQLIRKPSPPGTKDAPSNEDGEGVKMPLALGDAMKSFLAVTETQYFLLNQWYSNQFEARATTMGEGEKLDKVVMENCLGGRYSPGIDLTFIVRDTHLYETQWQGETGPFRIKLDTAIQTDYPSATKATPFLGVGYVPLRDAAVQPGDLCKFMSQPWHTDYNSCATHTPDPNPPGNNTLYWSWPAQRPVTIYPKALCSYDEKTGTWSANDIRYSVRGEGSKTLYPQQQGRYQCYFEFVENWHKVGFVIQGTQINDGHGSNYGSANFIEVASLYDVDEGDMPAVWPTESVPGYKAPDDCGPEGSMACPHNKE